MADQLLDLSGRQEGDAEVYCCKCKEPCYSEITRLIRKHCEIPECKRCVIELVYNLIDLSKNRSLTSLSALRDMENLYEATLEDWDFQTRPLNKDQLCLSTVFTSFYKKVKNLFQKYEICTDDEDFEKDVCLLFIDQTRSWEQCYYEHFQFIRCCKHPR